MCTVLPVHSNEYVHNRWTLDVNIISSEIIKLSDWRRRNCSFFVKSIKNVSDSLSLVFGQSSLHSDLNTNRKKSQVQYLIHDSVSKLQYGSNDNQFLLYFLSKLLVAATSSGLPHIALIRGFSVANQICSNEMKESGQLRLRLSWANSQQILSIIRSNLLTYSCLHHLQFDSSSSHQLETMSKLVLDIFLSVVNPSHSASSSSSMTDTLSVHFQHVAGPGLDCVLLNDALVMDIAMPLSLDLLLRRRYSSHSVSKCRQSSSVLLVALFDCSLEMSAGQEGRSVEVHLEERAGKEGGDSKEIILLNRFAQALQLSHVDLVCCQQRVHPHLLRELGRRGIVCLSRISARFLGALQRLSGARILGSVPVLQGEPSPCVDISSLGVLRSAKKEHLLGRPYVVVRGVGLQNNTDENNDDVHESVSDRLWRECGSRFTALQTVQLASRMGPYCSVMIAAESELLCQQMQTAVEETLRSLWRLLRSPYVCPGDGNWQAALVRAVQSFLNAQITKVKIPSRSQRMVQQAVRLYGDCLQQSADYFDVKGQETHDGDSDADVAPGEFRLERTAGTDISSEEWVFSGPSGASVSCSSSKEDAHSFRLIRGDSVCEYDGCLAGLNEATRLVITLLDIDEQIDVATNENNV